MGELGIFLPFAALAYIGRDAVWKGLPRIFVPEKQNS
jgi:hypothetical protein